MREEVLVVGDGGTDKLVTSSWSAPFVMSSGDRPSSPPPPTPAHPAPPLMWSASRCGAGVRLSTRRHSMRRDAIPGWASVLAESSMCAGRHAWSVAFSGRVSHVMVGIATEKMHLYVMPSVCGGSY